MQGLPDAAQPRDTPTRVPATAPGSKCASPATALGTGLPHRRPQLRRAFRCFSFILLVRAVCPQLFTALAGSPPPPHSSACGRRVLCPRLAPCRLSATSQLSLAAAAAAAAAAAVYDEALRRLAVLEEAAAAWRG